MQVQICHGRGQMPAKLGHGGSGFAPAHPLDDITDEGRGALLRYLERNAGHAEASFAEPSDFNAELLQVRKEAVEDFRFGGTEVEMVGLEDLLHAAPLETPESVFIDHSFMSGMLVHQHEAVGAEADKVGGEKLPCRGR